MSVGRPKLCPDQTCTPLCGVSEKARLQNCEEGDSFICFGRMAEPVVYDAVSIRHDNDLCSCHYTPRTRLTRWYENLDDWKTLAEGYAFAAKQVELDYWKRFVGQECEGLTVCNQRRSGVLWESEEGSPFIGAIMMNPRSIRLKETLEG